ncbi:retrograde regulation protein 2 [Talaromyces proteolyticus]|uniref:Retrograde regulation protein 2 n=1 Tax=Talaromyces proteolyticus TaxID=1131652 RepID=A0AAD4KG11_9EURO|nr:retrograde regulation protein 2 [Talaromyces proteolyticus]KAH8691151.1 retrograde regulation protein 2 [Talaromyces proteolyticus]
MPGDIINKDSHCHIDDVEASKGDAASTGENNQSKRSKSPQERKLLLKQDLSMLPLLAGCFFFAYVDRGQIGNARVMGMQQDLHLTNDQYFNALMVFFIGYMIIELPCALGLVYFRPSHQFGLATMLFGVMATCIAAVNSEGSLIAIRFILGLCEAFVQTGFIYLSLWYRPDEIALRAALFYLSTPLAGAVSGLISYGVAKNLAGVHGYASWQWLFIVEGVPTIAWGVLTFFSLPGRPEVVAEKGSFLFSDASERQLILQRVTEAQNSIHVKFVPGQVLKALKDPKTWLDAVTVGAFGLAVAAFSLFLPTFINAFGFSPLRTQLFSIIPYACAAVTLPLSCYFADLYKARAIPLLVCFLFCVSGLILLLATTSKAGRVAGTSLVAAGSYPGVILGATWVVTSHGGYTKRSTAWAVVQVFLQCFSIMGTKIYNAPPRFFKGHGVVLGMLCLAAVCIVLKWWIMRTANQKKDAIISQCEADGVAIPDGEKTFEDAGDSHLRFRYIL